MKTSGIHIAYDIYEDIRELPAVDAALLAAARDAVRGAHAPYSHFRVGAAVRLAGDKVVQGSNQENASFPLGLCAERVALAAASALYPQEAVEAIAVSYVNGSAASDVPVSPCGICRQVLAEYEAKGGKPIRVILGGQEGPVYVLTGATQLLPLSFSSDDLQGLDTL